MNPTKKINLSYNNIDAAALTKALDQFAHKSHEEVLEAFEAKLCEVTKSPYAAALNSGTGGIHLALRVLGVGNDDDVPVSTFTYVGSVSPMRYVNARPVFIDSEEETWNMDPNILEDYLQQSSSRGKVPKAIEVVHTYGMPAHMKQIMEVASRFEIPIIEDAAAGIGATWLGNPLGSIGDIGIISFNNNKTITTFGGGALLTKSKEIYTKVKFLAAQAREKKPYYEFNEVGYNYQMGPMNAIYGLAQLSLVEELVKARRAVFDNYLKQLNRVGNSFQREPQGYYSSRWLTAVLLDEKQSVTKERLWAELDKNGIESRHLWKPMHTQPVFKDFQTYGGAVSESLFARGLCLPSGSSLTQSQKDKIVEVVFSTTAM